MENLEHREFRKILRRHEEITQANCRALTGISAKLEELEANVLALLSCQSQHIDILEAECSRLHILVTAAHVETLSLESNNMASGLQGTREDKTVSQGRDPMDIEEQSSPQKDEGEPAQGSTYP
jgi:hypothetical protein